MRSTELMTLIGGLSAIAVISFLSAWYSVEPSVTEHRFDNVERVFMHEVKNYSILYREDASAELQQQNFCRDWPGVEVRLFTDVPEGKPIWARAVYAVERLGDEYWKELEIHVHAATDINAGGWNHGKFGQGQTVVVE